MQCVCQINWQYFRKAQINIFNIIFLLIEPKWQSCTVFHAEIVYTLALSPSRVSCLAHWAIQLFHSCLLVIRRSASSMHVTPLFSMSFVMLSFQVMRGRPILRDPSGIQLSPVLLVYHPPSVINFLRPDHYMPHLSPYHRPVPNSTEFCENIEIPRKRANSAAQLKIPCSPENCGA